MNSKANNFLTKIQEDAAPHHHAKEGEGFNKPEQVFDGEQKDCPICKTGSSSSGGSSASMMQHEGLFDELTDKDDKRFVIDTKRERVDAAYDGDETGQVIIKAKTKKEAEDKYREYEDLEGLEIEKVTPRDEFATNQIGYEKERKEFEKIGPKGLELEIPKNKKDWYMFDLD